MYLNLTVAAERLGIESRKRLQTRLRHMDAAGIRQPGGLNTDGFVAWFAAEWEKCTTGTGNPLVEAAAGLKRDTGGHGGHTADGLTPADRIPDAEEVWERALRLQEKDEQTSIIRYSQEITINDTAVCAIALLSDVHLGNEHTNYRAAREDAEIIRDTPGMYAVILGDACDNWVGKLEGISRNQPFTHAEEISLLRSWLEIMLAKLLAVASGNHENRTAQLTSIDLLAELLRYCNNLLYDQDELTFTLRLADNVKKIACRHKWKGNSMWNATHGIEKSARMGGDDWDIGVGAHTHPGTFFRWFADGIQDRLAIQLGSYQYDSKYARKENFPRSPLNHQGCGALIVWPDGGMEAMRNLRHAADYITWARGRA